MTVTNEHCRWRFVGDSLTATFPIDNAIWAASELDVYVNQVQKTLFTDYSVIGLGDPDGATVVFVSPPAGAADVLIVSAIAATQDVSYSAGTTFPPKVTEREFDRLTRMVQQVKQALRRALRYPDTDPEALLVDLPPAAARANMLLGFDSSGNPHTYPAGPITAPQSSDYINILPAWTGAISRTLTYLAGHTVYITQFAGAVGDDWTIPFQRAAAFISARGGTLKVPAGLGDIRITSTITFTGSPVWLAGDGAGINVGQGSRVIVDTGNQDGFVWSAAGQGGLRDIVITGPTDTRRLTGGSLIKVVNPFNFGWDRVTFTNAYRAVTMVGGLYIFGSNFRVRLCSGDYAMACIYDNGLGLLPSQNPTFVNFDISAGRAIQWIDGDGSTNVFDFGLFVNDTAHLQVFSKNMTSFHNTHLTAGVDYTIAMTTTGVRVTLPAPLALNQRIHAEILKASGTTTFLYDGPGGSVKFTNFTGEFGYDNVVVRNTYGLGNVGAFAFVNGGFEAGRGDVFRFETGGDYRILNVSASSYGHGIYSKFDPTSAQNVAAVTQYGATNLIEIQTTSAHGFDGTKPVYVVSVPSVPQAIGRWNIGVVDSTHFVLTSEFLDSADDSTGLPSTWLADPGDSPPVYNAGEGVTSTNVPGTGDLRIANSYIRGCLRPGLRVAMPRVQVANSDISQNNSADRAYWAPELAAPPTSNGGLIRCQTLEPHLLDTNATGRLLNLFKSGARQLSYIYFAITVIDDHTFDLQGSTYAGPYDAAVAPVLTFFCIGGGQVQLDPTQKNFLSTNNNFGDVNDRPDISAYGVMANTANPYSMQGDILIGNKQGPIRRLQQSAIGQVFRPALVTGANSLVVTTASDTIQMDAGGRVDGLCFGSPNGAITAPIGSTLRRRDGGTSTTLYVKESGSGNTGWVAK
jgi:hypothetical protein